MALSKALISQFAKVTNDNTKPKKESTMHATVPRPDKVTGTLWVKIGENEYLDTRTMEYEGSDAIYVHIDGAYDSQGVPTLTLVNTTVKTEPDDRVIVSIRNHMAVVTGNLTKPSTSVEHVTVVEKTVTDEIDATKAIINSLSADNITTSTLKADSAEVEYLSVQDCLDANYGKIDTLESSYAGFKDAYAEKFGAEDATIENLIGNVADIKELMFGSAAGEVIQASFASAVFALIKSINTTNVKIASGDESLVITGSLLQVKDASGNVRVQIGKDANGAYSILVCDEDGATMLDADGITENAIKEAIIVDRMIGDNANISGSKLDIGSVIEKINENGSASIKSSKIYFDEKEQTLDSVFADFTSDVDTLGTKYTEIHQDLESVTTTVADHEATITDTGTQLEVTKSVVDQLADSISMLVTDGNGTSLMTQTGDGWTFNIGAIQSAIEDLGVMSEYIRIGTHEGEPCIELGEGDSNFKLLITNTRIMFMDGSDIPAYINNKSLYIKKAVIEEELHQGGYSWVTRSNGHYSLVWKGVTE